MLEVVSGAPVAAPPPRSCCLLKDCSCSLGPWFLTPSAVHALACTPRAGGSPTAVIRSNLAQTRPKGPAETRAQPVPDGPKGNPSRWTAAGVLVLSANQQRRARDPQVLHTQHGQPARHEHLHHLHVCRLERRLETVSRHEQPGSQTTPRPAPAAQRARTHTHTQAAASCSTFQCNSIPLSSLCARAGGRAHTHVMT